MIFTFLAWTPPSTVLGSNTPSWNPYRPHYTLFMTYSSSGQSGVGTEIQFPAVSPNLRLGFLYWATNTKAYGGMRLDYQHGFGSASFSIHLNFLTPLSQQFLAKPWVFKGGR